MPSFLAFAVVRLLEQHFSRLVDYDFTAQMEDVLDEIATGDAEMAEWLTRFYFGHADGNGLNGADALGLKSLVDNLGDIDARDVNSFPLGEGIVARVGHFWPYVEQGEQRATIPGYGTGRADAGHCSCLARAAIRRSRSGFGSGDRTRHRRQGRSFWAVRHRGPAGRRHEVGEAASAASLFKTMSLDTVTLEDALRLLTSRGCWAWTPPMVSRCRR